MMHHFKTTSRFTPWLAAVAAWSLAAVLVCAQGYYISWHKTAGGGGTSTGGGFTLNGTIGQSDASAQMSNGPYSLAGGFWPGVALVQTPEAPLLSIVNTGSNSVMICWPDPSTGWVLQHNTDLNTANWMTNTLPVTVQRDLRCITITPPTNRLFFRLYKP